MILVQAVSTGSSVDPAVTVEHMEVQQSGSGPDSTPTQTSDADKGTKDKTESNTPADPPPRR